MTATSNHNKLYWTTKLIDNYDDDDDDFDNDDDDDEHDDNDSHPNFEATKMNVIIKTSKCCH